MPRVFRPLAVFAAVAVALAGCSDAVGPASRPVLSLSTRSHSIQVGEAYQLSVSLSGVSGSVDEGSVEWSSLQPEVATVSTTGLVTGARPGLAPIVARAGSASDTTRIRVARTPARIVIDPLPALAPGDRVQLSARVIDTEGEEMEAPLRWQVAPAAVAAVNEHGIMELLGEGDLIIEVTSPPVRAELAAPVKNAPPPAGCADAPLQLEVGEVRRFNGGAAHSLCLSGGAEYTLMALNAGSSSSLVELAGEGLTTPSAVPSDLLSSRALPGVPRAGVGAVDREFERSLRRRERERLSPRAGRPRLNARSLETSSSTTVGDLLSLNASASCDEPDPRTGRVEYVGERAIVVADTANPRGLTKSDYARFGALYDTLLYPVVTEYFGEPASTGDRRVVIFYTRAVNELTPAGSDGVVGGFFWAGDFFPTSACKASNQRGMFYMLAADPDGVVNGNERSVEYVERATAGTIAHELQHLINASRRIFVNDTEVWEEAWLNEGLSHIAEELVFYHLSGLAPKENLGPSELGSTSARLEVTNRHALSNLLRVDRYLREVEQQGPFQTDDDLATRGAAWQFLRYALDRDGGDPRGVLAELVDSETAGLDNLGAVFGMDPSDWFVDASIGLYTDDHVGPVADAHRHPSWNFRTVLDWINGDGFVLRTRRLATEEKMAMRIGEWGSAYVEASVGAGRIGNIRIGTSESPPSEVLEFALIRTR